MRKTLLFAIRQNNLSGIERVTIHVLLFYLQNESIDNNFKNSTVNNYKNVEKCRNVCLLRKFILAVLKD